MEEQTRVYDWDDEISNDGAESLESVVLPEGNYPFEVIKVEKAFYDGSAKMPACGMAKVYMRLDGGDAGSGLAVENLYLNEKMEWKAAAFLRSIGLKKHGENVKWNLLTHCDGESGRCRVIVDEFTDRNNNTKRNNKIDRFYDKEEQAPKKTFRKGDF